MRVVVIQSSTCPAGRLDAEHYRDDATCRCAPGPAPSEAAARGLKLLSKHNRSLHPRAQVQSLRRSAVRALGQADRAVQFSGDHERAAKLRTKAADATEAMLWLNTEHSLGYPVPR